MKDHDGRSGPRRSREDTVGQNVNARSRSVRSIGSKRPTSAGESSMPGVPKRRASRATLPRISGRMTARVLTLLERHGKDVEVFGLSASELGNPEARIDIETVDRLVEVAASALGAAGLGLRLADVVDADTYGAAGRVMLAGRTLRESFELGFKHQRLWGDTERFSMRADRKGLWIAFKHPGSSALASAVLAELALVEVMRGVKFLKSRDAIATQVRFVHSPLGGIEELTAEFGCGVTFGAPRTELALPLDVANAPLDIPREVLQRVLERDASLAEAQVPAQVSIVVRARALASDFPSLPELARRLKLSVRTLQRRLSAERSSHFALVDSLRRDGVARLAAQGLSDKSIAFEVGFNDERALSRARARWAR